LAIKSLRFIIIFPPYAIRSSVHHCVVFSIKASIVLADSNLNCGGAAGNRGLRLRGPL